MISDQDIDNLASLARIALSAEEKAGYKKDLESILGYVSQLGEAVNQDPAKIDYPLTNVWRTDEESFPAGTYSPAILAEAPETKDDYVVVKKILDNGGDN
ncbi:MAG: Asp-tRNA(Asn)/Glu-tRNA(Gln) amidotransferase subunit GatC [Patescibacteria group bacterium]|mgnify:CR=1 FL=1